MREKEREKAIPPLRSVLHAFFVPAFKHLACVDREEAMGGWEEPSIRALIFDANELLADWLAG